MNNLENDKHPAQIIVDLLDHIADKYEVSYKGKY